MPRLGLALMCVAAGMRVGTPLSWSTVGWEASTSKGRGWMNNDIRAEDSTLTVLSPSVAELQGWQASGVPRRISTKEAQEKESKILIMINKFVKDRLAAKRHILLELPSPGLP